MIIVRVLLITALCAVSFASTAEERRYSLLEREIEYMMEIWPGDYDNREQVQFDFNDGRRSPEEGAHARVHSQVRRVDLPAFGEYLLYIEDYRHNDPGNVFRQRLYELSADESEKVVRVRQHTFRDGQQWRGAHDDPQTLATLTSGDTTTLPGCDLLVKRDVDALVGGTDPETCTSGYELRLTESGYWFRDAYPAGRDADPMTPVSWHQLERARWFRCMIDFPQEDGGAPNNTVDYVRIHDQGGTYPFMYRDGREMVFTVRNTWSYGMQRETLVIVVQETDESGPTLVYGWGEPGSDRLGVNPGWIRLQCDLDTPKMRRFQHWLRPDS